MIDKKGRLFGRISLVDVVILLGVGVMFFGLLYRETADHLQHIVHPTQQFYVSVHIPRLREYNVPVLSVGDYMFRQHDSRIFGEIIEVLATPAIEPMPRSDGTIYLAPAEGRVDITFTMQVTGSITSAGYFVNGNDHVGAGSQIVMVSNRIHLPVTHVVYVGQARP